MKIVIKKKLSLDFLGEDYKEAYVVMESVPVSSYREIQTTIDEEADNLKKIDKITDLLKSKFIKGEFPDEDGKLQPITADDLFIKDSGIDGDTLVYIYDRIMGVPDPKAPAI